MSLSRNGGGPSGPRRWRRAVLAAVSSLSLGVGVVALGGVGAGAAGAARPAGTASGASGAPASDITVQLGAAFFITLLPPDPCSTAQVARLGCVDVIPGVLQVFGLGPVHLVSVLPISVDINNQYVVTLFPPGSCSIGSGLEGCRDVVPGVLQTQGIPQLSP
jgi:hypothetical protein